MHPLVACSVIMTDDLGKLPGDDEVVPKRKGLRRLRKAERALNKQHEEQEGRQQQRASTVKSAAKDDKGADPASVPSPIVPAVPGQGRQWDRRKWKVAGLPELVQSILGAEGNVASNSITDGVQSAESAKAAIDSTTKQVAPEEDKKAKGKKGPKPKDVAPMANVVEEEENIARANRLRREREAEVQAWAESLRKVLETETYVTTAHRVAVAARDSITLELANQTKVSIHKCGMGRMFHAVKILDVRIDG